MRQQTGKWLQAWVLMAFLAVFLIACGGDDGDATPFVETVEANKQSIEVLDISVTEAILETGVSTQLQATAINKEGEAFDWTKSVTWESGNTAVASVDASGLVTGKSDGMATITASYAQLRDTLEIQVSSAALASIAINSNAMQVDACQNLSLQASGLYSDGSQRNITERASWQSSANNLATVHKNAAVEVLLRTFRPGSVTLQATLNGVSGEIAVEILDTVTALTLTPATLSLEVEKSKRFTARARYSDGSSQDVTDNADWAVISSGRLEDIITIDNDYPEKGQVQAKAAGQVQLQASCGGMNRFADITITDVVTLESVQVGEGTNPLLYNTDDEDINLTAFALYSDGSQQEITEQADWEIISGDTDAIAINNEENQKGALTLSATGSVLLEVSYEGLASQVRITVE